MMARLDEFAPEHQFNEVHGIRIRAPRNRAYRAIKEVTAGEIAMFRALTWIRRLGRKGPESILDPPKDEPVLAVATRTGFLLLADDLEKQIVDPGFAKATMSFRIEDAGDGTCLVSTETRVHATDAPARRRFGRYWALIRPASGFLRRMWLRAIKRRAESGD